MDPFEAVRALHRAQEEIDDALARLGGAVPVRWRGPASRAYEAARDELVARAVAARGRLARAEAALLQFAAEASAP